jgi:hypothetical protein
MRHWLNEPMTKWQWVALAVLVAAAAGVTGFDFWAAHVAGCRVPWGTCHRYWM